MKRISIILILSLAAASCVKWIDPVASGSNIAECIMPEQTSRTTVPVLTGTGCIWTALPTEPWVEVNIKGYVKGDYAVTLYCGSNESTPGRRNFARKAYVLISSYDHTRQDTIIVKQKGLEPEMLLTDMETDPSKGECMLPLVTNLTDEQRPNLSFGSDASWVKDISLASDNRNLRVMLDSAAPAGATATITMTFTPEWGEPVHASCTLTIKR